MAFESERGVQDPVGFFDPLGQASTAIQSAQSGSKHSERGNRASTPRCEFKVATPREEHRKPEKPAQHGDAPVPRDEHKKPEKPAHHGDTPEPKKAKVDE
eukprot:2313767-Amphidinium_carterae.1